MCCLNEPEDYDSENYCPEGERAAGCKQSLQLRLSRSADLWSDPATQINTVLHPDGSSRQFSTRWSYDPRGRVSILMEADSKITRYGYTSRGELAQTIKPDGTILTFEYNDLGHRVKISSSEGTINHLRVFNRLGHLIQHDDVNREVDARGNLLKESFPQGFAIESSYDVLDRKIKSSIVNHGSFEWHYTACDLLRAGRIKHGQRLYEHCYLSYDLSGNLLEEKTILGKSISHGVDASSRKVKIQTPQFSQEVLDLDLVGNILRMRVQGEERSYTYDELYQLTSETGLFAHDYRYDSLYNRLQKDGELYQINDLQQVVSHFEYDRNGNPIRQGDTRYFYNALDRLIRLEKPDLVQTLVYDSENRCLSKTTHRNGQSETRFFIYDGQNEIGAFDQNMNLRELRFLGETPHAEIGSAVALELEGSVYAPIHDLQGNVALVLGEQHTSYLYSAFGEENVDGSVKSPWRFSSKRSDEESGLVYFGRRFYSPEFGRWLTPDPVGFADSMNLYAFVHNDPLTHFDEYGLLDLGQYEPKRENPYLQNASRFGRQLVSRFAHEMYNSFYMPLASEMGRFSRFSGIDKYALSGEESWQASKAWQERKAIDQFFGTHLAEFYEKDSLFACMELPAPGMGASVGKMGLGAESLVKNAPKFKPFTKQNARENLGRLTGFSPSRDIHAHHVFPKRFQREFWRNWNINVHDPKYLTWWESKTHLPNAKIYNNEWLRFFKTEPTKEQIFTKGKEMMSKYEINVNF